jgi:hypothetical protein
MMKMKCQEVFILYHLFVHLKCQLKNIKRADLKIFPYKLQKLNFTQNKTLKG